MKIKFIFLFVLIKELVIFNDFRLYLLVRKIVEVSVNKMKLRSKCLIKMSVDIICESSCVPTHYSKAILLC